MKRIFVLIIACLSVVMIVVAADFRKIPDLLLNDKGKRSCVGYTIIEFDKGIDCNGDTVKLTRKNGFAELALSSKQ
jgi:hypothetical protein